jgi:hypothetical protein
MKRRLLDFSGTTAVYPLSQAANVCAGLNRSLFRGSFVLRIRRGGS